MGRLSTLGKAAIGLGIGTLAGLAVSRVKDDRYVDGIWQLLEEEGVTGERFDESMVDDLPDPARRYFLHAIQPGTPLASRLHWRYTASMKPGPNAPWMELSADQILAKERGFVWKATAAKGPVTLSVRDHYLDGEGRMKISLFGLIPVLNATGDDLSRSAMGRLLIESSELPSAVLPGPNVKIEGVDDSSFIARIRLNGESTPITFTVDKKGRLLQSSMPRWGNLTDDGSYQYIPYGSVVEEEQSFGGYTIPTRVSVGWWFGTERYQEAIRLRVAWAQLY